MKAYVLGDAYMSSDRNACIPVAKSFSALNNTRCLWGMIK